MSMIRLQERQRPPGGTPRFSGCGVWLTRNAAVGALPGVAFLLCAFEEFLTASGQFQPAASAQACSATSATPSCSSAPGCCWSSSAYPC
jgi:hypothetical protein